MIKKLMTLSTFVTLVFVSSAQTSPEVTVIEFIEILDDQKEEALYYYQNNWKLLRIAAKKKNYIHSFQLMEISYSDELPAHLLLLTNFENKEQYNQAENKFKIILNEHGSMRLLNMKKPEEFRKNVMAKVSVQNY